MADSPRQAAAPLYGRENWYFVPTIAGYATGTGPTVAEMTGASSFDMTRTVFSDSAPALNSSVTVTDQAMRFGDTTTTQTLGNRQLQGGEMKYAFDPQAAAGTAGKKLWELLGAGADVITSGFFVNRGNVPRATTPTAGQFVEVIKVNVSASTPDRDGDGPAAEGAAKCTFVVSDPAGYLPNTPILA